ncbi:MAG: hypothetical protein LKJ90_04755 [Faecalibacterium sp.]|jgi:hypothetical protein|nr:hypothetical protein [Faecalibacterium sp.]
MKKAVSFWAAHLLAGFYMLAAVLTVLLCLGAAAWDSLGYATGRLHTEEISLSDVSVQDILQTDSGLWVSSGADPQLLLSADQPIRNVVWQTESEAVAQQAEGYYARNGAGFSLRRRVWAKSTDAAGGLELDFPLSGGQAARIDPVGAAGVVLAGANGETTLRINVPRPLSSYFCLRAQQVFWLLLAPALAAAITDWARSVVRAHKNAAGAKTEKPQSGKENGAQ